MEDVQAFLEGPLLIFAAVVFALGLVRLVILSVWALIEATRRAGDRRIPYTQVFRNIALWLFPVTRLHRSVPVFSYASFFFHLCVISSAVFMREHIDLFEPLGLSWPAIPRPHVDWLALAAFIGLGVLLGYRLYVRESRAVSGFEDYGILVLLMIAVGMGYLGGQSWNAIPYNTTMVIHMSAGAAILILTPFTKLAHCALYPLVRLSSEIGWHFTREGGYDVVRTLYGPEGRKI
jgi:nitrate reductase gamma subunit